MRINNVKLLLLIGFTVFQITLSGQDAPVEIECSKKEFKACISSHFENGLTDYLRSFRCIVGVRSKIEIEMKFEIKKDGNLIYQAINYNGVRDCEPFLQEWFKAYLSDRIIINVPKKGVGDIKINYSLN